MLLVFFALDTKEEKEIFNAIYTNKQYKNYLYKNAYSIVQDTYLAEDAVQETYFILIKNIEKIDKPYSKRTLNYLTVIVKNVSLKILKEKDAKNIKTYDNLSEQETEDLMLQNKDMLEQDAYTFLDTLKKLDSDLVNLMILKYVYGYSLKEISRATTLSEKNVGVRIFRGKDKLRKFLKKEGRNWYD